MNWPLMNKGSDKYVHVLLIRSIRKHICLTMILSLYFDPVRSDKIIELHGSAKPKYQFASSRIFVSPSLEARIFDLRCKTSAIISKTCCESSVACWRMPTTWIKYKGYISARMLNEQTRAKLLNDENYHQHCCVYCCCL